MSRLFKGYASDYSADQVQVRRVRRYQKRPISVDFNGALPVGVQIDKVRWDCTCPWVTKLSEPTIASNGRSVSVTVEFNYAGLADIKATVEADDGSTSNYSFAFDVADAPMYPSATYEAFNGPYEVQASA